MNNAGRVFQEQLTMRVAARAAEEGVSLSAGQLAQIALYIGLLTKWNATVNLTALPLSPLSAQAIDRLLIEPLVAAQEVLPDDAVLVDVGSGGGSPAVPLKIAAPWLRLVMIESRGRKSAFLREVIRELDWRDAAVETARLEDFIRRPDRPQPGIVSLRAVRADDELWTEVATLARPDGRVLWFSSVHDTPAPPGFRVVTTRALGSSAATLLVLGLE